MTDVLTYGQQDAVRAREGGHNVTVRSEYIQDLDADLKQSLEAAQAGLMAMARELDK